MLLRRLRVARQFQVSLKRLEGWEPAEHSRVVEFDGQGRAVSWVTEREPEWDDRERSLMLALDYYEATLCGRCQQPLTQTMDPMTDPDRPEAPKAWVADGPDECFCCKALVRADRRWAAAMKDEAEDGGEDSSPWVVHTPLLQTKTPQSRT